MAARIKTQLQIAFRKGWQAKGKALLLILGCLKTSLTFTLSGSFGLLLGFVMNPAKG